MFEPDRDPFYRALVRAGNPNSAARRAAALRGQENDLVERQRTCPHDTRHRIVYDDARGGPEAVSVCGMCRLAFVVVPS